ncbi:hypothetical protein AB0I00_02835 [Streptomyces sp. NPDC050803]|uniref:hypothetical protein n=1 Tax=unclassified Streptomyces TaxID=2593676 RepID=UPI00344482E3
MALMTLPAPAGSGVPTDPPALRPDAAATACLYGPRGAPRGTAAARRAPRDAGVSSGVTGRRPATHPSWTTGVAIGAGALVLVLRNRPGVEGATLVVALRSRPKGRAAALFVVLPPALAVPAAVAERSPAATPGEPGRAGP